MERINKATLLINLLFLWSKKEEIYQKCCRFRLGIYLCVQRKKGLIKIIPLKNKILVWL